MEKGELHSRNRHLGRYDFDALIVESPALAVFVAKNEYGTFTIDFSNPAAVKALNSALIRKFYGVVEWNLPEGYLCPPIPGRADYIHHAADVLAQSYGGEIPEGPSIRILDIGIGANGVYPIIGNYEYGWSFVGSDIDQTALDSFAKVMEKNPNLAENVELRAQRNPKLIFNGIIKPDEKFDFVISNPPFHGSREEAEAGSRRKWKNLGRETNEKEPLLLNFGGVNAELWCQGGERAFITRMIEESTGFAKQVRWFSALVAKEAHLPLIENALKRAKVRKMSVVEMAQGQKKSRFVAWTYG